MLQYAEGEKSVDALRDKLRAQMVQAEKAEEDAVAGGNKRKKRKTANEGDDLLPGVKL